MREHPAATPTRAPTDPIGSVDLHTHSTASDGTLEPAALVCRAASAGIAMLALTDHDTISGIPEAAAAASREGIELVPGVELSAGFRAQSIHVLGLWIDPCAASLSALLAQQAQRRRERLTRMCGRLSRLGLPGDACQRAVEAAGGSSTRMHLARALVDAGCVRDPEEAFDRYLGSGRPGCVRADWPAVEEIVASILAAGGRAVLAHPTRYRLSAGARRALLAAFTGAGGQGLEIVSGGQGHAHAAALTALAHQHGLQGSVGSDFHGPSQTWNPLGRLAKLPDSITPIWYGASPTREQGRSVQSIS